MPAYNGEKYINQAIESVLTQEYPDWELIVVNDGSTDNTEQIVSKIKDCRVICVYQENRGQAAALNHGLDIARGEYITTLDVDDWFTPNSLNDRVVFLDDNPEFDVVYGDGIFCDESGHPMKRFSELRNGDVRGDVFDVMLSNSFFGTGANVMIRRSALDGHNIRYDESIVWCQDYDLYLRLAQKCQFGFVDALMVWYRVHRDNMTITMPSGRRRESLVRTKYKALESVRFARTPIPQKVDFFWGLLMHDLDKDVKRQVELMEHRRFQVLPKPEKARLMRLCASNYLPLRQNEREVREMLKKSWKLFPYDPKIVIMLVFAYLNKGPIKWLFNIWSTIKLRNQSVSSPFDQNNR